MSRMSTGWKAISAAVCVLVAACSPKHLMVQEITGAIEGYYAGHASRGDPQKDYIAHCAPIVGFSGGPYTGDTASANIVFGTDSNVKAAATRREYSATFKKRGDAWYAIDVSDPDTLPCTMVDVRDLDLVNQVGVPDDIANGADNFSMSSDDTVGNVR